MRFFRDAPLKRKLMLIIMATSSTALLVATLAFAASSIDSLRRAKASDLLTLARIVGADCAVSLSFSDPKVATQTLSGLRAKPTIIAACVYDENGQEFAHYLRPGTPAAVVPRAPERDGYSFSDAGLRLFQPVSAEAGADRLGTIYLEADNTDITTRLREYAGIAGLILVVSLLVAFGLSLQLQAAISRPVLDLTRTASVVSAQRDYSIRVPSKSKDEIGLLVDRFNEMLAHIEQRDIVLRQMNEQLTLSEHEAQAANQAKSAFLARMSHELRTPLNAIIGYSEMLQEEAEDAGHDDLIADLQKIHGAGKHLLALINDILDLSKVEAGRMDLYLETFPVPQVIQEVVTTVRPLAEKNRNTLLVECPDDPGTVHADLTKIRQMLFNLLSNASKFTTQGSIKLRAERSEEWLTLSVSDTGIGMSAEQLAKVFEPFTQADASTTRKYGGTGLGLAITQRFAQMMGGTIDVRSEVGRGTTFTIRIPADVSRGGQQLSAAVSANGKHAPVEDLGTVLAIDDDESTRDLIARFLRKEGFRVETAACGEEGLRRARELMPDVITLDVMMPSMDGWAVLGALKAEPGLAEIPVVMLTMVDDRNLGFSLGAADYITKPVDWSRFISVLKRHGGCRTHPVLVIEDEPETRELLERTLEQEGWNVAVADNGRAGLEEIERRRPSLVLLDLMMPGMDGFQVAEALRKREEWRSIPVIVLTARDLTNGDRERLDGLVQQVLQKGSCSREELLSKVRAHITDCVSRNKA